MAGKIGESLYQAKICHYAACSKQLNVNLNSLKPLLLLLGDERNIQKVFVAGRDVTLTSTPAPAVCSAIKPVVPFFVLCLLQLVLSVL